MKVTVVGAGTAGLVAAIVLKSKLPLLDVSIIESKTIGIIGVGEGSTEHWHSFVEIAGIDIDEMVRETAATHKLGIRFENWTNHTPDYFHSISGYVIKNENIPLYEYIHEQGKLLTNTISHPGFIETKVVKSENIHRNTNQYHFDTFKLNHYLQKICSRKNIKIFIDDLVSSLIDETGYIRSVASNSETYYSDFWIDASGFSKFLIKNFDEAKWVDASQYLLTDTAIPFPTKPDPSGLIRQYTRAIAMSSGWMWEIPTQERRGNGYVFSSSHLDEEQAINEIQQVTGHVLDKPRVIKFNPGYISNQWVNNCAAIGLSSSFLEPLEATSISTAIQQAKALSSFIPFFKPGSTSLARKYNSIMNSFHENLIAMVSLHYISDRRDTSFWKDAASSPKSPLLSELLELWAERPPSTNDVPQSGYELFQTAHFWHVAQGQGLITRESCSRSLDYYQNRHYASSSLSEIRQSNMDLETVYHHEIF
jgi:tryptophan halogenase